MKKSIFSELPPPPPPPPPPTKISRRKLYIVVGLVAVVAIAAHLQCLVFYQVVGKRYL
ncbi:MAG: hypothetical protein QXN40_03055 [Candidatus Bathyarchaeia archaeon]